MEKTFNVAGPCFPADHYMLPALDRMPKSSKPLDCFASTAQNGILPIRYMPPHGKDDAGKSWDEKLFTRDVDFAGKTLHVVGL